MDANKKIDLEHVRCPPKSKILTNIIKNHPLQFSIAASSYVPWIYMAQFWHTLKEDGLKYRLKFVLDKKELFLTLDDFRTIFHLPQANDNNHDRFVPPSSFSDMVPFYKNELGFIMELKTSSSFKTTGLLQPWQTSTRLTPPTPVPTVDKADEKILQDTLQVSLAEHKSKEEQEARENMELVNEHLASMEIEKMVEEHENVIDDSSIYRHDEHNIPGPRLEPRSDKESLEVEFTDVVIPVNVNEEEEEITDEVYELKQREKGKIVEEYENTPFLTPLRSLRIYTDLVSSNTKKLQELTELQGRYGYLFKHLRARFMPRNSFATLADHLQEVRDQVPVYVAKGLILERQKNKEEMEKMIAKAILQERGNIQAQISLQIQKAIANDIPSQLQQQDISIWLALQMKFRILQVPHTTCRTSAVHPRDQDDPHDDAYPKRENKKQLDKEDFQELGSMAAFNVLETQFQMFIISRLYLDDEYVAMTRNYFIQYTQQEIPEFCDTLIQHLEYVKKSIDEVHNIKESMTAGRTESKEQDTSSRSGNDAHDDDADIRPIHDEEPMAEVQTTTEINVFAIRQQHTEQNSITKIVAQFQKDFSRMEAHCVNLELKYQNKVLKVGQQSQFLKEKSNEAKVKHDIDAIQTLNIELEYKVAKLLKENKTLKKNYKELFNSIKIMSDKTIEHTTSLIASNDNFKAQLQEKGFAIAALKNELRKLKGNIVNTKFAKQSIVRQPTAFKFERPRISEPRFASQVDVYNDLSKPVTTHYLPKERETASAKPHHMIASSNSRISSKNIPRFSSNDMVHNHYLDEAKKKTQERNRNSEPSLMPSAISELGLYDHINKQSSSKLVPKVIPPADKTVTSRQELELLFHHHITMLRKEILVSSHPQKTTPLAQSCQRDPKAPTLSLINQDLLYLKKGSSGLEKIVLSLRKFSAVIFNDDDIEEQTFRWKEPGKPTEVIYSNSQIIQVIKTYWELGHEHKFITEMVARRANECIVSITEPDFKNLNKNNIKDMYMLIMNGKKVNLTAPTISFLRIKKHEMFFIIYEPVHGIIYKNSKKEKRVMRLSKIHKFCDATLNRVLEGLKSYNNDVKYGYIQKDLTKDEAEYLKLFKEEIEVRLKYHRQMRRWEMYVNGRPLGPRREHPE
nr:hypothetical protein [Tanacetum cinerariifolium]